MPGVVKRTVEWLGLTMGPRGGLEPGELLLWHNVEVRTRKLHKFLWFVFALAVAVLQETEGLLDDSALGALVLGCLVYGGGNLFSERLKVRSE
ncbi:hypothetical protein [Austwickia chelonae]|uniref:hypothetical protein n=1 Tax=Austwickia chelonae TaxID=100225 RepID=UPI000E249B9D|nr:hypothetical protein [Austwickia chelonae]